MYKALYDYTAQRPDELSFKEGDLIYIIDMLSDKNWWRAKSGDLTGLVPFNYSMNLLYLLTIGHSCRF